MLPICLFIVYGYSLEHGNPNNDHMSKMNNSSFKQLSTANSSSERGGNWMEDSYLIYDRILTHILGTLWKRRQEKNWRMERVLWNVVFWTWLHVHDAYYFYFILIQVFRTWKRYCQTHFQNITIIASIPLAKRVFVCLLMKSHEPSLRCLHLHQHRGLSQSQRMVH